MADKVRYVSDKQELFLFDDNTGIPTLEALGWTHDPEWKEDPETPDESNHAKASTPDYKELDKKALVAEAENRGLEKSGTVDELRARLVEHDAQTNLI